MNIPTKPLKKPKNFAPLFPKDDLNNVANGNAKTNLTYVEAIVERSLFNFFCRVDLRFWKKAPKNVMINQFIVHN